MSGRMVAAGIFLLAYILFMVLPRRRTLVAVAAALALIVTKTLSVSEAMRAINWNVMGIFVGTLVVADIFMESRVPAFLAEHIVARAKNTTWAILFICALASFLSAFVENVATVLIIAPIAFSLARKLRLDPTNLLIAIAICSNLQGTATLIGDPPSMLLGGFAKMNFMDFFFYRGKPSIFFAVELGALASFAVLYLFFRAHREKVSLELTEKVRSWVPTVTLIALIVALAYSSVLDTGFSSLAGIICMVFGVFSFIFKKMIFRQPLVEGIRTLDWETTFFLMGVFVIVGSITQTGWIDTIADTLSRLMMGNIFLGYTLIVVVSMLVSAVVDNVPFLAAMLPVGMTMAQKINIDPSLFLFGLLIGASIGGNITPIGASANIVACGLLKKEGYHVRFGKFARMGLPFTLAAVAAAYLFIWFVWGPR